MNTIGMGKWFGLAACVLVATSGCGDEAPPQGRIVFAATAMGETHSDLYAMDADGTHLERLTNTPSESEQFPRWSPDRSRIAYMRGGSLMVSNRNGQDVHVVTTTVGRNGAGITAPDWSPDGTKLVYSYPRPPFNIDHGQGDGIVDESYRTNLHVIHADGTGDTAIPEPEDGGAPPGIGTLTEPAWSSTGVIAFFRSDDCPDCAGGGTKLHDPRGWLELRTKRLGRDRPARSRSRLVTHGKPLGIYHPQSARWPNRGQSRRWQRRAHPHRRQFKGAPLVAGRRAARVRR